MDDRIAIPVAVAREHAAVDCTGRGAGGVVSVAHGEPNSHCEGRPVRVKMKCLRLVLAAVFVISTALADWQLALPGWQFQFPRDHGIHPDFKTEWWYFT